MTGHAAASTLIPVWWLYNALGPGRRWLVRDARRALREALPAIVDAAEDAGATKLCVPRDLLTPSPPRWGVATVVIVTPEALRPRARAEVLSKLSRRLPPLPGVQTLLAAEDQLPTYSRTLGPLKCFSVEEARHAFIS